MRPPWINENSRDPSSWLDVVKLIMCRPSFVPAWFLSLVVLHCVQKSEYRKNFAITTVILLQI